MRHLLALDAVARTGSFAAAADDLDYTQSAVSQQIAALERAVGHRLIRRPGGRRPVELTEAGRRLVDHVDAIVARLRAAEAELEALARGSSSALRVGTFQSAGSQVLPAVVRRLRASDPDLELTLHERSDDEELFELLRRGRVDISFAVLPPPEGPFGAVALMEDPYMLVAPAGAPSGRAARASGAEPIAALSLIGFRSCRHEERVLGALRAEGVEVTMGMHADDNATLQSLVAAGAGCALMPRLTVDFDDPRTVALEPPVRIPPRPLGLAWHRDRPPSGAARTLIDAARRRCAEIAGRARGPAGPPAGEEHAPPARLESADGPPVPSPR